MTVAEKRIVADHGVTGTRHATYGGGLLARVEGDRVVVQFYDAGYRTVALDECLERGLLRAAD